MAEGKKKSKKRTHGDVEAESSPEVLEAAEGDQVESPPKHKKKKQNKEKGTKVNKTKKSKLETNSEPSEPTDNEPSQEENEEENSASQDVPLDPDTLEMKRRKREKRLKKKEAKRKQREQQKSAEGQTQQSGGSETREACLAYLRQWQSDRPAWKFNKNRQTWLLKHMYDPESVPDEEFSILLEYIEPLKGFSRTNALQNAEQLTAAHDTDSSDDEEEKSEGDKGEGSSDKEKENSKEDKAQKTSKKMTEHQLDRVRQVIQILS